MLTNFYSNTQLVFKIDVQNCRLIVHLIMLFIWFRFGPDLFQWSSGFYLNALMCYD